MSGYLIAIGGAIAVPVIGLITGHLLLAVVVVLAIFVLLLGWAGTRLERQLHGDSGIQLEQPKMSGQWIQLGVRNGRGKTSNFTGTVENIYPAPPDGRPLGWTIPWLSPSGSPEKSIPPHGLSYLSLGHGDIAKRNDGELAGCVAFHEAGRSEIPFNYENTHAVIDREPVTVTVRLQRNDPPAAIEADFLVEYPILDGPFPMYPTITLAAEPRPTRG